MSFRRIGVAFAVGVVGVALVIQLVPYRPADAYRPRTSEPPWDSGVTRALAERACFDCHSAETRWPWYATVAPTSWLVRHHVAEGRALLDFSRWDRPGEEAYEAAETVREGTMPPGYYLRLHPEARLAPDERAALAEGLDRTLGKAGSADEDEDEDAS